MMKSRNSNTYLEQACAIPKDAKGSQSIVKDFIETYQNQFDQMESDIVQKDNVIDGCRAEIKKLRE